MMWRHTGRSIHIEDLALFCFGPGLYVIEAQIVVYGHSTGDIVDCYYIVGCGYIVKG
jgi:hypothetical protein